MTDYELFSFNTLYEVRLSDKNHKRKSCFVPAQCIADVYEYIDNNFPRCSIVNMFNRGHVCDDVQVFVTR
jgi:hypothetical protein